MTLEFGVGHINLKILVLRPDRISAFPRPGPTLSHSIILEGKHKFLKKF